MGFGRRKAHPIFTILGTISYKNTFVLHTFSGIRFFIDVKLFREGPTLTKYCACQQNQRFGIAARRLHPGSILEVF